MPSTLQKQYLKAMGIDLWQRRAILPDVHENAYQIFNLFTSENLLVGVLLLENMAMDDATFKKVNDLLYAILHSVQLKCELSSTSELASISTSFIFIMGEKLAQSLLGCEKSIDKMREDHVALSYNNILTMVTYHPLDLIQNTTLKRCVWHDVQRVKELILKTAG